jgi:hypothetical protein
MSEEVKTAEQQPIQINVDSNTAFALKLQEFDKLISESEAQTADLKRQKATFVYESNVNALLQQQKQKEAEAEVVVAEEVK